MQTVEPTTQTHRDPRIPHIIKRVLEGATYGQIAKELGMSSKGLYLLRTRTEMKDYVNQLWDIHIREIAKYAESDLSIERMEAFRERGRTLRHIIPTKTENRSMMLEIQAKIDLTNRRSSAAELLEKTRAKSQLAYEVLKEVMLEQE